MEIEVAPLTHTTNDFALATLPPPPPLREANIAFD